MADYDADFVDGTGEYEPVVDQPGDNPKITELQSRPMEMFRHTEGGNGARFVSRFGQRVLCEANDNSRVYYIADATNLWSRDTRGVVNRMAAIIIDEMYTRAEQLTAEAAERATSMDEDGGDSDAGAVDEGDPGEALRSHARQSDTARVRRSMPQIAVDDFGLRIVADEFFDKNPALLSCGHDVIELLDHEPWIQVRWRELSDKCMMNAPVGYDPEILQNPPEMIRTFIRTFLPEKDKVRLLFKLFGHALKGGNPHRFFVILKGGTTSGKTQLMVALQKALGEYAGASQATIFKSSMDDRPRPDVIELYKKRLAFLAEASKTSWTLQASRIKLFTGGDVDPQRRMRSDKMIKERPQCMPVIYTNEMPKIIGMDEAMKRRVIVPTMNHSIDKKDEDVTIREKFINDLDVQRWLLAALVQGYVESVRDGMNDVIDAFSLESSEAVNELYHLSDFLDWMQEGDNPILVTVPEAEWNVYGGKSRLVAQDALYGWYKRWLADHGDRQDKQAQLNSKDFNAQLKANHGFVDVKSGVKRWAGYKLRDHTFADMQNMASAIFIDNGKTSN